MPKRTPLGRGPVAKQVFAMLQDNGIRIVGKDLWFQRGNTKSAWPLARWGADAERNGTTIQLYSFRPMKDCRDGLIVAERGANEFEVIPKTKPKYMPQAGEKVVPVNVPKEAADDLEKIIKSTGLRQSDVLRYTMIAALRVLAENDSVTLPIHFSINGEHKPKK